VLLDRSSDALGDWRPTTPGPTPCDAFAMDGHSLVAGGVFASGGEFACDLWAVVGGAAGDALWMRC